MNQPSTHTPKPSLRQVISELGRNAFARFDGWANPVTGFGTARDKTTYGAITSPVFLSDETLSALYHTEDMAARMVDIVPEEMLREGFEVATDDKKLDGAVAEKLDDLGAVEKFTDGLRWGRLYGGGALLVGADDGRDASLPLIPERARDVSYLYAIDRRLLWPASYYDESGHPKLGQPRTYAVTTVGGWTYTTAIVHESRLILFRGAPTGTRERIRLSGWDMSVLQRPHDVLRQFNTGWTAVENLLVDGNQGVYKITGLAEAMSSGGGMTSASEYLGRRMTLIDQARSVVRALVIDADAHESFDRHSVSFADIPATLDKFMLRLAAAVQIPVTILMGQSPAGMNATGESDFRWFYDRIKAQQNAVLAPRLRRLVDIWLRTKAGGGKPAEKLTVRFPSLWAETPLNEATRRKAIADADAVYINAQVFTPEEVALARFRPGDFGEELRLTEDGVKAREDLLKADLEKLGEEPPPQGAPGAPPALPGAPPHQRPEAPPPAPPPADVIRTDGMPFELHRHEDETGVSGTGVIAEGMVFEDGSVVLRWKTKTSSTTSFANVDDMLKVHGHNGKTELVYLKDKP